jgi:hypothetical protein
MDADLLAFRHTSFEGALDTARLTRELRGSSMARNAVNYAAIGVVIRA